MQKVANFEDPEIFKHGIIKTQLKLSFWVLRRTIKIKSV